MTEQSASRAVRPVTHISTLWAWLFVGLLAVALVVGVLGRVFSSAVVLDLISFWPFLVVIFLVAAAVLPRSRGRWLGSVVPLLLIGWLLSAIVLHLTGWDQLPSAAARLTGPIHVGTASMTVEAPGIVELTGADQPESYLVIPRRAGGEVGAPEALERQMDTELSVGLRPTETSHWFRSEGWDVRVSDRLTWDLRVTADELSLELSGLTMTGLVVSGDGRIVLPAASENVLNVEVEGNVTIVVTAEPVVQVIGEASVPATFQPTEDGHQRGDGEPIVTIQVIAGLVTIEDAPS